MTTIVDTDVLIALVNQRDSLHNKAKLISQRLINYGAEFILLPTTLGEFATLSTIRIGLKPTKEAIRDIATSGYITVDITDELTNQAVTLYQNQTSKEESLFDCYVMVVAKRYRVDCIFSFDHGYAKNEFVLAEDFVKEDLL